MKRKDRVPQRSTQSRRMRDIRLSSHTEAPRERGTTVRSSWHERSVDRFEKRTSIGARLGRSLAWIIGLLVIVLVVGAFIFERAHIIAVPHTITGPVNVVVSLDETPGADLVYETMRITRESSQRVEVAAFETEQQQAFGTITIYNEESQAQRLVEETRFETSEGLIFKLGVGDNVTVPGAQGTQPGSVEAVVYAERSGAAYNIEPTDFVIPGWRETNNPKFETQYARSFEAMTGGGEGRVPIIDDIEQSRMVQDIEETLQEQIIAQAWVQAPDDFIFLDDMTRITFSEPQLDLVNVDGTFYADVTLTAVFETVLLDHAEFARMMAEAISESYMGEDVRITNISSLESQISSQGKQVLGWEAVPVGSLNEDDQTSEIETTSDDEAQAATTFEIRVTGEPILQMQIDPSILAHDLAGAPVGQLDAVLAQHSEVRDARVAVRPFWRVRVPRFERISVVIDDTIAEPLRE